MDKTQKKSKRNIFSKFLLSIFAVLVSMTSVLFAGCSDDEVNANTGFDSYGNIRLNTPDIEFFEKTKDGNVSDCTGSFYMPLEFYTKTYNTASDDALYKAVRKYYDQDGAEATSATTTNIAFPDYVFTYDGTSYQIHTKYTGSISITGAANNFIDGTSKYVTTTGTFNFFYRTKNNEEWKSADSFVTICYRNNDGDFVKSSTGCSDKTKYLRFSPRLENGATTRSMTVKSRPNPDMSLAPTTADSLKYEYTEQTNPASVQRGESLASTEIYFGANKMTFETYSMNGTDKYYG